MDKKEFLLLAKQQNYVSKQALLLDKGKKLISKSVESAEFHHAVCWRHAPFVGQEVLSKKSFEELLTPIWYMNFTGATLTNSHYVAEIIFDFLRSALSKVDQNFPFRGPQTFEVENLVYRSSYIGNVNHFSGDEEIHLNGAVVYRGHYFGGVVQEKQVLDIGI